MPAPQEVALQLAAALSVCNLNGDWSNGHGPHSHIEFFQQPGQANFTLRTTAWGAQQSYGTVLSETARHVPPPASRPPLGFGACDCSPAIASACTVDRIL